jgi:tetraacyldisaccharide 4'-kinase
MACLLRPFALIFSFFALIHRLLYRSGIKKKIFLTRPVISVGNLTVGGTGKTPFVDALLSQATEKKIRACVLSRGYGRTSHDTLLVSDKTNWMQVGDEPQWLFLKHKFAKILVSESRALEAKKISDVDFFILDDGRQHYKLHRNLEITLIDASKADGHYKMLPEGRAREPWQSLKRSDLIILTRVNQVETSKIEKLRIEILATQFSGQIIESQIEVTGLVDFYSNQEVATQAIRKVYLASGIANPKSFEDSVKKYLSNATILKHFIFKDHESYLLLQIVEILSEVKSNGGDCLIITEKDAIKWTQILKNKLTNPAHDLENVRVYVLNTKLFFKPELPDVYDLALSKYR